MASTMRPNKLKSLFYVCSGAASVFSGLCYYQGNEGFFDNVIIPFAHCLSPETSHNFAVKAHKYGLLPKSNYQDPPSIKCQLWDIDFCNPLGMAAGFDKHGEAIEGLHNVGFSFVEIGSVTPIPQPGNDKPRVFRLSENKAIINRYGFNSDGHEVVYNRLKKLREDNYKGVIGVNLGKNKTSNDPIGDYVKGIKLFSNVADYLVINISSPNTVGLRDLQGKEELENLLRSVLTAAKECQVEGRKRPPLLLKLAPDLTHQQLVDIAQVLQLSHCRVDGLVVSNTSTERNNELSGPHTAEEGGLSGKPIADHATSVISQLYTLTKGELPIIGVGGIFTGEDAYKKIKAGASLIQIYTAYVYHGPPRVTKIKQELQQLIKNDGYKSLQEAIGKEASL